MNKKTKKTTTQTVKKKKSLTNTSISKEERKAALRQNTEENIINKEKSGFSGPRLLNLSKVDNVKFFTPRKGENLIDIIPYIVKTKKHPKGISPGYEAYLLDVFVHKFVGPSNGTFLCLKQTYGKPCPICEERASLEEQGADKKEIEALYPTRRALYNVRDLLSEDDPDEIMIWDVSYFLFEKEILEEAETAPNGEYVAFADTEEGKSISFRAVPKLFKGNPFFVYKKIDFEDREASYDDSILEQTFSLDELLVIPSYEEVREAFLGVGLDEEEEDENHEENECAENEEDYDEEDEEDDKQEDDDDEEEIEEEVIIPKKRKEKNIEKEKKQKTKKCPNGFSFGEEWDEWEDCSDCELWKECGDSQEAQ